MTSQVAGVVVAALSLAIGWAALWPARRHLGSWGYHLAAFPVGMLSWTVAAVASTVLGRPLDAVSAPLGVLVFVLVLYAVSRLSVRDEEAPPDASAEAGSYAVAALVLVLAGAIVAATRLTIATPDSWTHYWPMSVELAREGTITTYTIATRGISLIAITAAEAALGGNWAYLIYPLMGMTVFALLVAIFATGPFAALGRRTTIVAALVLALFLATNQTFFYHTFYVHSHMIFALYLLLALTGIWMASDHAPVRGLMARSDAWLVVAGASAAGLALARPDGIAHVFVPVAIALSMLTAPGRTRRSDVAFFAPLLFVVWSVYLTLFVQNGLWDSSKLDGRMALVLTALLGLTALAPAAIRAAQTRVAWRFSGDRLMIVLVIAGILLMAAASVLRWETVRLAAAHAYLNLLGGEGAWGHVWWAFAALLLVSIVTGDALRPGSWSRTLFLAIVLYFVAIALIHGITAPGRIGTGATLTRVAFHIVPVILWYIGVVAGRILADRRGAQRGTIA